MSSFTTPLEHEPTGRFRRGRPIHRITKAFQYHVGELGSGLIVDVEEGYETDFWSVPGPLRRWYPIDGEWAKPPVGHDRLYRGLVGSRFLADLIFLQMMRVAGVPPAQRWITFLAVRAFGWLYFGRP